MCSFERTILKLSLSVNRVQKLLLLRQPKLKLSMQRNSNLNKTAWDPNQIFDHHTHYKYAVVILNSPLYWKDVLLQIWKKAQIKLTVDGGTCRWLHYLEEQNIDLMSGNYSEYVPQLITGDMDSCSPVILEKLKRLGSMVIETPEQNATDYTKALIQLRQYAEKKNISLNGIYVFVESAGRFDQIMANINTLYKVNTLIKHVQVIQIASNSFTWLLSPGFHSIAIPEILVQNNCWCGLLPVGGLVNSIRTTGLKWNLDNDALQFGVMISTSNTYDNCHEVTVNTDSPVIWTMGIEPLQKCKDSYKLFLSSFG